MSAPPLPPPTAPPPEEELAYLDVDYDHVARLARFHTKDVDLDQVESDEEDRLSSGSPASPLTALLSQQQLALCEEPQLGEPQLTHIDSKWCEDGPVFGRASWLAVGGALVPGKDLVRVSNDDLQEAALRGDLGLVRRLIHAGASVNAPMRPEADDEFLTMLHILASKPRMPNGTRIIAEIIAARANLNARSTTGSTPLIFACDSLHLGAIEVLLDKGAHTQPVNDYGLNAASSAVLSGKDGQHDDIIVEVIHLLARAGADLDDGGDVPPITEAVKLLNAKAVTTLVELGATPIGLHEAVDRAPLEIIKTLVDGVANPFLKDRNGNTVMDLALQRGDEDIKSLLRDFIGDLQRQQHKHCETQQHMSRMDGDEMDMEFLGSMKRHVRSWVEPKEIPEEKWYHRRLLMAAHICRKLTRNRVYATGMFANLIVALFLPDVWIICDFGGSDTPMDMMLLTILFLFLVELVVQTVGHHKSYTFSFFFWMDLIGCVSVPLDISIFMDLLPNGTGAGDGMVMRVARLAKLGTRAGRFTKLVKLLRFLPGMHNIEVHETTAVKVITNTLNTALSCRVSCLIIIMVMVTPLFDIFRFPGSDASMGMWINVLGHTCWKYPSEVPAMVADMLAFYAEKDYKPFEVYCFKSDGYEHKLDLGTEASNNKRNRIDIKEANGLHQNGHEGVARAIFDFTFSNRKDSALNCLLIVTIIILMTGAAIFLTSAVSAIVLTPLETLLESVKKMASHIFAAVKGMAGKIAKEEGDDRSEEEMSNASNDWGNETEILQQVLRKLVKLSELTIRKSPIDEKTLAEMGESDRAVLADYKSAEEKSYKVLSDEAGKTVSESSADDKVALVGNIEKLLSEASMQWEQFDKADFDVLALSEKQRQAVCMCLFLYERGADAGSSHSQVSGIYANFIDAVRSGYGAARNIPYHNWFHAVDVAWMIHRTMKTESAEHFLSQHERFALMISALCHDIGHPGVNNGFLVETGHELAIRYNDNSPSENLHCARMFEIARQPNLGVFDDLDEVQRREVRSASIDAILHTDYKHHLVLVKGLADIYDSNAELFDTVNFMYNDPTCKLEYPSKETVDLFCTPEVKSVLRNAILHFCDVSNPVKPFVLAQVWAYMIIEEFFNQGDKERELGLAVQPLNDRDKVNKPQSQVGFIEFFVAPYVITIEKLVPPVRPIADHLFNNLHTWFNEWVDTTRVPEDEQTKVINRMAKLVRKRHGIEHYNMYPQHPTCL